jgi:hypothetical protein
MEPTIEQHANAERPTEVTRAVQFLIFSLAIGLLTSIFHLAQRVSGVPMVFALASFIVIAVFGIGFFLISKISARRNWARIVWLVLVLFGLPFAIPANLQEVRRNVLSGTLSIIVTILQLIGTYLLFIRNSNLWFRTRK